MAWAVLRYAHHPDSLNDESFIAAVGPFDTEEDACYWLAKNPAQPLKWGRGETREVAEMDNPTDHALSG